MSAALLGLGAIAAVLLAKRRKGVSGVGEILHDSYEDRFVTTTDGMHAVYFMVDQSTGEIVASGYDLVEVDSDGKPLFDTFGQGLYEPDEDEEYSYEWKPTFFIGRFQDWETAAREAVLSMYDHTWSDWDARKNLYMFNPDELGLSAFDRVFLK